ncbi:MAG TPA: hypothetical protein VE669_04660 [Actinomycetota bacterium]|nr:hypothetical protein [Actinomycetota bacterium]
MAVVALLAAAILSGRGSNPGRSRTSRGPDGADRPVFGDTLALPRGLGDLTAGEPVHVTFASTQREGAGTLYRLWRLELPSGRLAAGPAVGEVTRIVHAPPPHDQRIAFLVNGGGLFVLDGFVGRLPTLIADDVEAADFDRLGRLVFASAHQRPDRSDGTTVTEIRYGLLDAGAELPAFEATDVLDYPIRAMTVRGGHIYAWGTKGGQQVLTSIAPGRPDSLAEHLLGTSFIEDLGPGGLALLSPSVAPSIVLSPTSRARPAVSLGLRVHRVLAWGAGSFVAFAGSPRGSTSRLYVISLDGAQRRLRSLTAGLGPGSIDLSPRETLLAWSQGREIRVTRRDTGRTLSVVLPDDVPDLLGPLAVG